MAPAHAQLATDPSSPAARIDARDDCWGPGWCRPGSGPYLSGGAIAAIVLGSIVGVALLVWLCMMGARRNRAAASRSSRGRSYYTTEYETTPGVRGGGLDGVSDYEVSEFSGSTVPPARMKKAKTKKGRHSRRY